MSFDEDLVDGGGRNIHGIRYQWSSMGMVMRETNSDGR